MKIKFENFNVLTCPTSTSQADISLDNQNHLKDLVVFWQKLSDVICAQSAILHQL